MAFVESGPHYQCRRCGDVTPVGLHEQDLQEHQGIRCDYCGSYAVDSVTVSIVPVLTLTPAKGV